MKFTPAQTERFFMKRLEVLGLTQAELARKIKVTPAELTRYKQRKRSPQVNHLEKIAAVLEVDVVTLLIGLGAIDTKAAIKQTLVTKSQVAHKSNSKITAKRSLKLVTKLVTAQMLEEADELVRLRLKARSVSGATSLRGR